MWYETWGASCDVCAAAGHAHQAHALATVSYDREPFQDARLVGHDPQTDQLYFLDQGVLYIVPTTSILPVEDLRIDQQ
jgi:hypothetical protein